MNAAMKCMKFETAVSSSSFDLFCSPQELKIKITLRFRLEFPQSRYNIEIERSPSAQDWATNILNP